MKGGNYMNKVFLIGRLTKDPELRFTSGKGLAVTTFGLAVDRNYKGQGGERQVDFINIVAWRKLAEHIANYVSKGRLVAVSGAIQTRKYQAQDGSNRYVTEVVAEEVKFLDYAKEGQNGNGGLFEPSSDDGFFPTDDGEIPF